MFCNIPRLSHQYLLFYTFCNLLSVGNFFLNGREVYYIQYNSHFEKILSLRVYKNHLFKSACLLTIDILNATPLEPRNLMQLFTWKLHNTEMFMQKYIKICRGGGVFLKYIWYHRPFCELPPQCFFLKSILEKMPSFKIDIMDHGLLQYVFDFCYIKGLLIMFRYFITSYI